MKPAEDLKDFELADRLEILASVMRETASMPSASKAVDEAAKRLRRK